MGTTTTNLGLYKPSAGETGWGTLVDGNFDTLDTMRQQYLSTHLVRYVDPGGDDGNDGLGPVSAFATIQAAYDDVKAVANATYSSGDNGRAAGRIVLLPGDHDVGSGLVIDRLNPVEIVGALNGGIPFQTGADSTSRIYTSSASATELILISGSSVTYGNRIADVSFLAKAANTALTACVRTNSVDHFQIERVHANADAGVNLNVPLLEQATTHEDNAWLRMLNCQTHGLPLYYCKAPGANSNRSIIAYNVCLYRGTYPMIWLEGEWWSGLVIGNNLETRSGTPGAPHVRIGSSGHPCYDNMFIQNSGEAPDNTQPFYDVVNGSRNYFIGGQCTTVDNSNGTWIQLATAPNHVWNQFVSLAGAVGRKNKLVDNSPNPAENIFYGKNGRVLYQKSGGFTTFSASDYALTPADGSILGCSSDTADATNRVWFMINGAYKQASLSSWSVSFPTTSVLDDFNRADGVLSSPWAFGTGMFGHASIVSNQVTASSGDRGDFYTGLSLGANQEAFVTIPTISSNIEVWCRVDHTVGAGYLLRYGGGTFSLCKATSFTAAVTVLKTFSLTLTAGGSIGLAVSGTGLAAFYKQPAGSWTYLGSVDDSTYSSGPDIGFHIYNSTVRIDDFGGGTRV